MELFLQKQVNINKSENQLIFPSTKSAQKTHFSTDITNIYDKGVASIFKRGGGGGGKKTKKNF
mgnify:CR=1 FL=1